MGQRRPDGPVVGSSARQERIICTADVKIDSYLLMPLKFKLMLSLDKIRDGKNAVMGH